jgi:hypothetical protein
MDAENANQLEWKKRPDYEHHLWDPLELFYDRGHGVHDPFDETIPRAVAEPGTRKGCHYMCAYQINLESLVESTRVQIQVLISGFPGSEEGLTPQAVLCVRV